MHSTMSAIFCSKVQPPIAWLPPLTMTSFKAMDVTLTYAQFLKIGNVALYQEWTILIVSKFQYTQCIGRRPVKLKPISRGISSEWYTNFVYLKIASQIMYMQIRVTMSKLCIQMQTSMKRGILSEPFQCKPEMAFC